MKKMIIGGWLAMGLLFAGCGKADEALKELDKIKADACACKDATCANKVQEEFEAWAKKHSDTKGTQSQADKATAIAGEISECMVKAMGGADDTAGSGSGSANGSADK